MSDDGGGRDWEKIIVACKVQEKNIKELVLVSGKD